MLTKVLSNLTTIVIFANIWSVSGIYEMRKYKNDYWKVKTVRSLIDAARTCSKGDLRC